MPFPSPDDARAKLDELIETVPNMSAPSTTKFNAVNEWLADGLGIDADDVYTVYVSKPGNLKVRLDQRGRGAKLGFAILTDDRDLAKSIRAGRKLAGSDAIYSALAFCVRPAGSAWSVAAIIKDAGDEVTEELETAFPGVEIVEPLARPGGATAPSGTTIVDASSLAESLFVDKTWLQDVLWLLEDKKGIVLYGPPGTGKTFIARKIVEFLQPDAGMSQLVQLHPSYGYEEFFEGYRPTEGEGLQLAKQDGPLRRLARAAESNPDERAYMVLDEMNRGNLPKVFGELFFLLEYRDQPVRLMYSPDEEFTLPPNLYFIGTMNTADRSIALLDQALRRRFHFVGLFPGEAVVDGVLTRYLASQYPELEWVADVLFEANRMLGDRNVAIGPTHFMRDALTEQVVARVWRYSVLPTIEEHFFGDAARLVDFKLDALRALVRDEPDDDED